ncbi:hypothetical protein SDC9_78208 [bioreactor metagenome]|uniref:Uncharacterized protein n=1 Tax=bioreactor metagenome TaxID=1076179 RepID=A0A644YSU5_9ZZZZ
MLRRVFDQRLGGGGFLEIAEGLLVGVGADERGHQRQQSEAGGDGGHLRVMAVVVGHSAFGELFGEHFGHFELQLGGGIAGAGVFEGLVAALFEQFKVGEHQFGQDHFEIVHRIEIAVDVDDIGVLEEPHHVGDGIDAANVAEKLVAEALPLTRALDQSGDIDEFERRRHDPTRFFELRQHLEPGVRHRHDPGIGLDGAERKIRGFRPALAQRIEQRRFADVGQTDQSARKTHIVNSFAWLFFRFIQAYTLHRPEAFCQKRGGVFGFFPAAGFVQPGFDGYIKRRVFDFNPAEISFYAESHRHRRPLRLGQKHARPESGRAVSDPVYQHRQHVPRRRAGRAAPRRRPAGRRRAGSHAQRA